MKLHLAKQSEGCHMPPYIIGKLIQELPNSYCLSNVLDPVQDDNHPRGYRMEERKFQDYVNRTYVYRTEILGLKPDFDDDNFTDDGGGLG